MQKLSPKGGEFWELRTKNYSILSTSVRNETKKEERNSKLNVTRWGAWQKTTCAQLATTVGGETAGGHSKGLSALLEKGATRRSWATGAGGSLNPDRKLHEIPPTQCDRTEWTIINPGDTIEMVAETARD